MNVHQLYPTYNLNGLTARQVRCVALAVQHETHRAASRSKDERLGDETREREAAMAKELQDVTRKMRPLCAQVDE